MSETEKLCRIQTPMQLGAAIHSVALAAVSVPRPLPPDIQRNTSPPGTDGAGTTAAPITMMPTTERESIYLKCRVCLCDIQDQNNPNVNIFSKDFLDEKIRRYLYVNIDFSDKYPKRICQICLIKLDDIHGFACYAQKNQQVLARFRENQREAESEAAAIAAAAAAKSAAPNKKQSRINVNIKPLQQRNHKLSSHKKAILTNNDITIFAYDDLKLGQFIKDHDLLTLILKALKWDAMNEDKETQLERLRQANFQDVLCNPDLLQDEDLMQLLGPYMNREPSLSITRHSSNTNGGIGVMDGLRQLNEDKNITEMEVGVDPELFFPDEDDETRSAEETTIVPPKDDVKPILCADCPQLFTCQADLLEHNKLQHDTSVRLVAKKKHTPAPPGVPSEDNPPPLNLTVAKVPKIVSFAEILPVVIPIISDEPIVVSDVEIVPNPKVKLPVKRQRKPSRRSRKAAILVLDTKIDSDSDVVSIATSEVPAPVIKKPLPPLELPNTRRRISSRRRILGEQSSVKSKKVRTRNTNRFTCHQCGRKLSTKGNLKVHLETHKPKGKFNCDKCGRVFKTLLNLGRHQMYHSGEKFACPHCSRVYPTNSTLRAHIITHSNVRPHECPMCFKSFKRNQDLKFHINQHTGDKPYKCPFCPKAFASSGNCFSHRKRMHSEKMDL